MRLKDYNTKRNFAKTTEPKGTVKNSKQKRFVIQLHNASHLHYDFRLEHNGVLLSWAIPKGLSKDKKIKRLAIMVEDHPISYINFEGTIPKGEYGAGTVEVWDKGVYSCPTSLKNGLKNGNFKVDLKGEKLNGRWAFIKIENNNWLVIYEGKVANKNPFKQVAVELATLSNKIPTGNDWAFEIKYDGYRIVCFIEDKSLRFITRNNINYTKKFPSLKNDLLSISNGKSMVLDGEVVVFNESGKTDFGALQEAIKFDENKICYVVFDILALNGEDLREKPLKERKEILKDVLNNSSKTIILSDYIIGKGKECYNAVKKLGLEGIVAKKLNSAYIGKRTEDWLKIKCYLKQEFVIGGYQTSENNEKLSAILLGYYNNNKLYYVGKTGTGFSEKTKEELNKKFKNLIIKKCPFEKNTELKKSIWVKPELVCEIQFAELTKQNILRQASFLGLREDKNAKSVILEV